MKHSILKYGVLLLLSTLFAGCSLLKVSVSTGDPLPKEDLQARVLTRGFYYDLTAQVARTADSIAAGTPDVQTKIRATRWKMQVTRAAVDAAMQSIPEVAMADMWILCRRMNMAFMQTPDSLLFGAQTPRARLVTARIEKQSAALARKVLTAERYTLMERFVKEYTDENPADGDQFRPANTSLAWIEYLRVNGIKHTYAQGSISEVMADMTDRVSGQTQHISNALGWSKDLIELQLQQDSTRMHLGRQLDSLERSFARMATVVEHAPQISDYVIESFNGQVQSVIWTMNASVDAAFKNIDRQRAELQLFVAQERAAMMRDASKVTDRAIEALLDGLPAVVGKVIFWIILLMVVVLGLPFAAGFWLGALRERSRERKKAE